VLADPAKHAAIDGTGLVREPLDSQLLTAAGRVFRMAMYHGNHPDGNYRMANRVQAARSAAIGSPDSTPSRWPWAARRLPPRRCGGAEPAPASQAP
jgi:hypothetical protein